MTMEEYFKFLEDYWKMFPPPTSQPPKKEYKILLL